MTVQKTNVENENEDYLFFIPDKLSEEEKLTLYAYKEHILMLLKVMADVAKTNSGKQFELDYIDVGHESGDYILRMIRVSGGEILLNILDTSK